MKNTTSVRVRIAPSPTGNDIHIGNLYTALMNWAYARKHVGQFIVRIEDTDRERYVSGAEEKILQSITNFGLTPDESPLHGGPYGPYRQSERLEIYQTYAKELLENGHAYYCFCKKQRLEELRKEQMAQKHTPRYDKYCLNQQTDAQTRIHNGESYVIRLNVHKDREITFTDLIRGEITISSNEVDDQVLIKSDGYPTYHMAVVVDDHLMKISHIIRAEEWIPSSPKHVLLYQAFGWELPIFVHLPILRNPDRSKLSKRKNPVWASWYLEEGYLAEAVLNYLALMGWSHPEEKEIFSLDEFKSLFELQDIKPVGPVFDLIKLTWMNQQYIMHMPVMKLCDTLKTFYADDKEVQDILTEEKGTTLVTLSQTRMKTLRDFKDLVLYTTAGALSNEEKEIAQKLVAVIEKIAVWEKENILDELKVFIKHEGVKWQLLYLCLTGRPQGLPLADIIELEGKARILKRLRSVIA